MARIGQTREKDRFEQEQADFFTRVRAVYLERAAAHPERYALIDGNRSLEEVRGGYRTCAGAQFRYGCLKPNEGRLKAYVFALRLFVSDENSGMRRIGNMVKLHAITK